MQHFRRFGFRVGCLGYRALELKPCFHRELLGYSALEVNA